MSAVTVCLCCGSADLEPGVLDLGSQPLANAYAAAPDEKAAAHPLSLSRCDACGHLQLAAAPDAVFGADYAYATGTSRRLRDHFAGLARGCAEAAGCYLSGNRDFRALVVASNDGTEMRAVRDAGFGTVHGIDPARNLVDACRADGLDATCGFWGSGKELVGERYDCVTACNVLAHTPDPLAFLIDCRDHLKAGGTAWVEVQYAADLMRLCQWDMVYHEHRSFFLLTPLLRLAARAGLGVTSVTRVPTQGGSLRVALRAGRGHDPAVAAWAAAERLAWSGSGDATRFGDAARAQADRLGWVVEAAELAGLTVVGFGAAAKTTVACHAADVRPAFVVDDAPLKVGRFVPGTAVPVRPVAALGEVVGPVCLVAFAWNFLPDVVAKARAARGRNAHPGDCYLTYVPAVHCRPLDCDPEPLPC